MQAIAISLLLVFEGAQVWAEDLHRKEGNPFAEIDDIKPFVGVIVSVSVFENEDDGEALWIMYEIRNLTPQVFNVRWLDVFDQEAILRLFDASTDNAYAALPGRHLGPEGRAKTLPIPGQTQVNLAAKLRSYSELLEKRDGVYRILNPHLKAGAVFTIKNGKLVPGKQDRHQERGKNGDR